MGGDPPAPAQAESTDAMLQAYAKYFPQLLNINAQNLVPQEWAKLQASQAVSPGYTALQQQLYNTYGPLLANTSNDINAQQQMGQAKSDSAVLAGPGKDLINQATEAQKLVDPGYYNTRDKISGGIGDLLGSININGGLSGGEKEELGRSQARENSQRGIATNPSQTAALQNALTFGSAQHGRELENKNLFNNALNTGANALPNLKSGQDAFQIGTGRSSMPNAGDSKFVGNAQGVGDSTLSQGNSLLSQIGGLQTQQNDINANRRDPLDRSTQVIGSL